MSFASKSFMEGISEIKHAAVQLVMNTVEDDPRATAGIVAQVTNGVFGELTTNDKLRLMSEVNGVGALNVSSHSDHLKALGSIEEFVDVAFAACVDHHLRDTKASVAAVAFAVGFLPTAVEAVELAEMSAGTKWMPVEKVQKVRTAIDALTASEGTPEDMGNALEAATLFDGLLEHSKDKVLHQRHHTDSQTIARMATSLKFYRDLLGRNQEVGPLALSILSDRQRNLPIIEAERERILAQRNRP